MKRSPLFLLILVIVASCARRPMPQSSMWNGEVELAQGKVLPFHMNLDFSSATPSGYFIVGDEKTPIPEISRNGDELVFRFSEYGAEMRAAWDGRQLSGAYRRIRSSGTKSFSFRAEPAEGSPKEAVLNP